MSYIPQNALSRFCAVIALIPLLSTGKAAAGTIPEPVPTIGMAVSKIPFIANEGQLSHEISFFTQTSGTTVVVTRDGGIVYVPDGDRTPVYRESFIGSPKKNVRGGTQADVLLNYYQGTDPSSWRESVKTYHNVLFGSIYENIEVELYAHRDTVEKVFTVYPGGDVSDIRCRIEGGQGLQLSDSGYLTVLSSAGRLRFTPPVAYQIEGNQRHEVGVSYNVYGNEYGFLTSEYDHTLPLVIDPILASTYMGGKSNETTYAMKISGGDIVVAGTADSSDFPGLDEKINVLGDAFIVRLDPDLSTIRAATYFGGSMPDGIRDIAVDGSTIYAAGYNNSPNFPTTAGAAFSGTSLSGAFIARLDARTLRMTAATSFYANVFGVARSPNGGDVYVAGSTGNTDFPVSAGNSVAFQMTHKGQADSFIAVFDEDLTSLKGATMLGGEGFDIIYNVTVDEYGYPVVSGVTNSAAFPVTDNAFDTAYNLSWEASHQWIDGFVARLTPDLSALDAGTYLGGGRNDNITAVDTEGSLVLVGGNTASPDFPCGSTFGPVDGNDAFVVLLNEDFSSIKSCALFGGSRPGIDSPESVSDVAFHPSGSIFAVGRTNAKDFPTSPGAFLFQPAGSYFGAFIIAFKRDMSNIEASTLIKGSSEEIKAIDFDSWGDVVVAGDISGGGYPVTGGVLQAEHAGGDDLILSRFTPDLTGPHIETVPLAMDFGNLPVGMEGREKIILYNTGGSELIMNEIRLTPVSSPTFDFESSCFIIPAFGSCSIEVLFKPVLAGNRSGGLVLSSNDHFRTEVTIELRGKAVPASIANRNDYQMENREETFFPRMEAKPSPCVFGQVRIGKDLNRTIRLTNTGNVKLTLNQVVIEPEREESFRIRKDSCSGAVLASPYDKAGVPFDCEISVVFTPSVIGDVIAGIRFSSRGPFKAEHKVLLTGTGVGPENLKNPGIWGLLAILVLVLRMALRFPVSASGWRRWMGEKRRHTK